MRRRGTSGDYVRRCSVCRWLCWWGRAITAVTGLSSHDTCIAGGARVSVYICRDRRAPDPKLDIVNEIGIPVIAASDDDGLVQLQELLSTAHVVVDAVLGIGRLRPLEGTVRDILLMLSEARGGETGFDGARGGCAERDGWGQWRRRSCLSCRGHHAVDGISEGRALRLRCGGANRQAGCGGDRTSGAAWTMTWRCR